MSKFGPEEVKQAATAFWDMGAHLNNLKDAVFGSATEVAQTVVDEVQEEIVEVAKSPSSLVEVTKAAATLLVDEATQSAVPAFNSALQCSINDRPSNLTLLNTALEYCLPEMNSTAKAVVQEGSSYLPYLLTGATVLGGLFTASKLSGTKATLQTLIKDKASYAVIGNEVEIVKALDKLMKNPAIAELIKALTPTEAQLLVANKDLLVESLKIANDGQQLFAVQQLLKPVFSLVLPSALVASSSTPVPVLADLDAVLRQVGGASSSVVDATQNAPKVGSADAIKVELADKILTSEAGVKLLATIRSNENSAAVLALMNEKSLKTIEKNAAVLLAFSAQNSSATFAKSLIDLAAKAGQVIELEAKKPAVKLK